MSPFKYNELSSKGPAGPDKIRVVETIKAGKTATVLPDKIPGSARKPTGADYFMKKTISLLPSRSRK